MTKWDQDCGVSRNTVSAVNSLRRGFAHQRLL